MRAFLSHEMWPFALAAVVMIALAATEALALLVGMSLSHWLDGALSHDADGEAGGIVGAPLGWLHIGRVPLLAILVIFLTTFAVIGFTVQFAAERASGHFLAVPLASALSFVVAIGAVRVFGGALGRMIPKDETNAVSDASLVGRIGTIVIGTARAGKPAQARIHDEHGTAHYVMVEPDGIDQALAAGASILLVRHLGGRRFHAIPNPKPELL